MISRVMVAEASDLLSLPGQQTGTGAEIQFFTGSTPVVVGFDYSDARRDTVLVKLTSPSGASPCRAVDLVGNGRFWCRYRPLPPGRYAVSIVPEGLGEEVGRRVQLSVLPLSEGRAPIHIDNLFISRNVEKQRPERDERRIRALASGIGLWVDYRPASATLRNPRSRDRDTIQIRLLRGVGSSVGEIGSCKEVPMRTAGSSFHWCQIKDVRLSAGTYSFEILVNGRIVGRHRFEVYQ